MAADALRRAKYQLRDIGAQSQAFALLHGLVTVAAVTRSEGLATEVRVLVRVVRRRPGMNIDLDDALRIATMASAAYADIDKWCTFLGEWLTESKLYCTQLRNSVPMTFEPLEKLQKFFF